MFRGEDQEQGLIGEQMVKDATEERRVASSNANRLEVEAGQVKEALQPLWIGGDKTQCVQGDNFGFFGVFGGRLACHTWQLTILEPR